MHKNRVIIILGILIFFIPQSGFTPSTKTFLIEFLSAAVVILAFFIERKGFFSLQWRKKNTTTPVARTYVEHNGNASIDSAVDSAK
jgi:hypothetical protein